MTTSIDTNVIVALWLKADPLNEVATGILNRAGKRGNVIVSAPVYVELMGDPARDEAALDKFLRTTGIAVEWTLDERVWREAGLANRSYIQHRRSSSGTMPRRLLTDFLIGAHALVRAYTLLTLDLRLYTAAFPRLTLISS